MPRRGGGIVGGTVTRDGASFAEAAGAVTRGGPVVLLSSSLHNDLQSVEVVRRRMLVAGGIAAAFAIGFGYALATLFARRIRRLEAAAERIAGGRFDETVVDPAPDELGQLARAFERMRLRLATLDRARAEFIANASHELRTPLFSLTGFLELLDDEEIDAATRAEFLGAMRDQLSRLTKLATDLLDLSRMDAGRLAVAADSLDLDAVAGSLAVEFGPRAAAAGHELEVESERWVPARGDEERVRQIVRILLENAIVHTPAGTTVTISRRRGRRTGDALRRRRRPGHPRDRPDARLRAVLSARRDDRVRQRPRPRDRARARRADGRPDRAGVAARVDPLHARACDGRRQAARAARGPSGVTTDEPPLLSEVTTGAGASALDPRGRARPAGVQAAVWKTAASGKAELTAAASPKMQQICERIAEHWQSNSTRNPPAVTG